MIGFNEINRDWNVFVKRFGGLDKDSVMRALSSFNKIIEGIKKSRAKINIVDIARARQEFLGLSFVK
jgi:hypothetical protein